MPKRTILMSLPVRPVTSRCWWKLKCSPLLLEVLSFQQPEGANNWDVWSRTLWFNRHPLGFSDVKKQLSPPFSLLLRDCSCIRQEAIIRKTANFSFLYLHNGNSKRKCHIWYVIVNISSVTFYRWLLSVWRSSSSMLSPTWMTQLLTLSISVSWDGLKSKLISAACICSLILSFTTHSS